MSNPEKMIGCTNMFKFPYFVKVVGFIFHTNDAAATTAIGSNGSTRPKLENPGILLGLGTR